MTRVLRPSDIESGNFLREDAEPKFTQTLEERMFGKMTESLHFGGSYSHGGDIDFLLYFDETRDTDEVLEAKRTIVQTCEEFRCRHFDAIFLWRHPSGKVDGMKDIRGVGLLSLLLDLCDDDTPFMRAELVKELDRIGGRTPQALREHAAEYASHKTINIIRRAGIPFDAENPACMEAVEKILSFPAHLLRKLWQAEGGDGSASKAQILNWAVERSKSDPWFTLATAMLQKDFEYRALLGDVINRKENMQTYVEHVRELHETNVGAAIELARQTRV